MEREEVRTTTNTTNYPSNYENDPLYKDIKLNEKLTEELKLSETLCNQFKNSLGRYYQDLQNNFNNINNILGEKQELKKNIGDLDDHNSKLDTEIQEKDNVIQRKDTEIQEKDNVIQEKNKIIQEMNKEIQKIQEKDKIIKEKNSVIQENVYTIQEKDNNIQELKGKNIQKISEEKDKKIQKIIEEKDKEIQEKDKAIQEKDKTIQEKDKAIKAIQEDDKAIQENDRTIQEKDKEIQEKDKAIQELEQENHKLKKEASEYQYAPTNYRFSDDDKYNPIKLKEDIINLQRSLENYITKCKGNVEINISEVQNLLRIYGSETTITIDQKPLIKAVLQRHVIEQIIKYGEEYFDFKNLHHHWEYGNGAETNLYNITYEITRLAEILASERDGIDETTRTLSIKLRQEVFAALANRGFNDIINGEKHDFIKTNQYNLNSEINKYRKLKDPEQNQEIEDMAGEIIRKVIALFWFLIEIQEPVSDYRWFNCNDNIQPNYMEGTWEDDEINNIAVDICYFPLIECNNGPNHQIYTPAKVLHKISETVEN
ncbi:hypothetical protein RhiirA5_493141 [Rhizophagus irregularis]|uniref:Uncharacterized protein n=1 Tax=Rhizophagus irregularis TaxID=588596 RepID=A0A2N0QDU6_9GLOM|nr:hypothetical protein RhiirA5_493141 [Rhizophagus irregularis]PKC71698.1 hypothetical protein RhiirA1_531801 [Rhizophagus irregularis]